MPEFDNTNKGAAFRKHNVNPKAPQFSGPLNVEGKDYEISVWEKTSKNGDSFLTFGVQPPYKKGVDSHNKAKGNGYQPQKVDEDDDINF